MSDNLVFVDTNILIYSRDLSEPDKQRKAFDCMEKLWQRRTGRISTQVLNEYFVTVTKKLDPGLSPEEAWQDITALFSWKPFAIEVHTLTRAREAQTLYSLSWWDALIVAAADMQGCSVIFSEDLSNRQHYFDLRVENPLC